MKFITDVPKETFRGKRVVVRAGLDVPLDSKGEVADLYRITQAAQTLRYLSAAGARVIILSHIGRKPEESNAPVALALRKELPVTYVADLLGPVAQSAVSAMKDGEAALLENLRQDPREAANDEAFARELANLGELYVDDAFSVAHRSHASIVGIPKFLPSYAGILMKQEIEALQGARAPQSPSLAILGGAKFETKAPLIAELLQKYDKLFITGALANDVFRARGLPVGASVISQEAPTNAVLDNPRFLAPLDVTAENPAGQARVIKPDEVAPDERLVDIGPDSIALLAPLIQAAQTILWNGPTGLYEAGYVHYTEQIARLISRSGARAVIGGGDTIASIQESGVAFGKNVFLSTGGGAMLDYLLQGTLPGIEALG